MFLIQKIKNPFNQPALRQILSFLLTTLLWLVLANPSNGDGITSIARSNRFIREGEEAMKKKDWKSAIKAYENLLKEGNPVSGQVHLNLGNAYYQNKNTESAQKNYLSALGLLENTSLKSVAYQQIGNLNFEKKDYKTSLEWYKKSLKANPANDAARFNYELAYKLNQKQEEEKQKDSPQKDENKDQKDEKKDEKKENQKQDQQQGGKDQKGKDSEKPQDDKAGKDQKKSGKDNNDKDKKGKESDKGEEKNTKNGDKDSDKNQTETEAKDGENSKTKNKEAQANEEEANRVDKKKLQEIGLTEEQAKTLLQAMRQSEIKYLQQRRFGNKKGSKSGKNRW